MIETGVLAKILQDGLNANSDNIVFKIFADDGKFQKAVRQINTITKYVNGVYTVISSDLLPFKALNMYTITATLDLIVDVENQSTDENGNYVQVEKVKKVLNNYGNANNGQIFTIDGLDYQISAVYNFATVGTEQVLSPLGRCIPVQMWIRYQFVENGVNSNSANIYINGESIPVQIGSITRLRTMTNNNYSGDIATKATGEQNSLSIDLTAPLLSTNFGKELARDVLMGGNNKPYIVNVNYNDCAGTYLMTLGTNVSNFEINKNVGQKFSLVEVMPELVDIASLNTNGNVLFTINTIEDNFYTVTFPSNNFKAFISWGDGTGDEVTPANASVSGGVKYITHNYNDFGKYNVYIYMKLGGNKNIYEETSGLLSLINEGVSQFHYFSIPAKLGNTNITGIADSGFRNFSYIQGIDFGDNIATIGSSAFEGAMNSGDFIYLKFPRSLTSIGEDAFAGNMTIREIKFKYPTQSLLTTIGDSAFEGCTWLSYIELPKYLTTIGADAFKSCSKIEVVKIYATTPPTMSDTYLISSASKIYIPRGSLASYTSATYWQTASSKYIEFDV